MQLLTLTEREGSRFVVADRGGVAGVGVAGPVEVPQLGGQGSGPAVADRLAVDGGDRHDAAGGGGGQDLGGDTQVTGGQPALVDRLASLAGQLDRGAPGHPGERAGGRGEPPAAGPREDVVAGALGDGSGEVLQRYQVGAMVVGLEQGQVQIQPVVVLDPGIDAGGRDAEDVADPQAGSGLLPLEAGNPDERHGVAVEGGPRGAQVAAAGGQPAPGAGHRDVRLAQARVPDAAVQDVLDLGAVIPRVEPQPGQAGGEPVQMGVQPEEPALPDVDHVVGAVRAGDAQVEHRELGFLDRDVPAIYPRDSAHQPSNPVAPSVCSRRMSA